MDKTNCEVLKRVQAKLNDPDVPRVVVPPGIYEVYETLVIPGGKQLLGEGRVVLFGHTTPVIDCKEPVADYPVDGFRIEMVEKGKTHAVLHKSLLAKEKILKVRCKVCKGLRVEIPMWVNPNTMEINDDFGSFNEPDARFCYDCDDNTPLETFEDEQEAEPQAADVVRDLLLLAGRDVPAAEIEAWERPDRVAAINWATRVHLNASDNDIDVPPMPGFLSKYKEAEC